MSIHPRVENGRTKHKKVNSSEEPKNPDKGILGKRRRRLQDRRQARDVTVSMLEKSPYNQVNAGLAFRRPGSMKG